MSSLVARTPATGADYPVSEARNLSYLLGGAPTSSKGKLDLYLPRGSSRFPVIVSIHGGALVQGDKSSQEFVGRRFAAAGIGTAVINYRLSPEVLHPAHVEDVAAAFAWVKRFVGEFGGRADNIFVIGHSAGGYLAALLATDGRYLARHRLTPVDIRGVVPVSGFFWVDRVAPERPKSVWGDDRRFWVEASPPQHLGPALPPTLLIYADGDEPARRRQNIDMAQAARSAGSERVELVEVAGRDHLSLWNGLEAPGDVVAERIIAFVHANQSKD
ncbi:MAG: alpha/beta hydrolase [Pseudomonadota bacterium]